MRVRRSVLAVTAFAVAGVAALASACRAFDSSDDGAVSADASTDSNATDAILPDAPAPMDGGGGADARPPCMNLVPNPSFEDQRMCVPWTNFGGTQADGTPGRTGANACQACGTGPGSINIVTAFGERSFAAGEMVHVELWVRAQDSALVAFPANLYVETATFNSGDPTTLHLTKEYQRLTYDYVMPLDGGAAQTPQITLGVPLDSSNGAMGCVLIDDVTACRGDGG